MPLGMVNCPAITTEPFALFDPVFWVVPVRGAGDGVVLEPIFSLCTAGTIEPGSATICGVPPVESPYQKVADELPAGMVTLSTADPFCVSEKTPVVDEELSP